MQVRRLYSPRVVLTIVVLTMTITGCLAARAWARPTQVQPQPILRPVGLLDAKRLCSNTTPKVQCRAELRKALASIAWQKTARRHLARRLASFQRPLDHLAEWTCIHQHEGAWNSDTGNGYQGGLQMDHSFSTTYGPDMWRKYGNGPHTWTPRDQIIVAERAYDAGRGFNPWPNTARMCGLL